MRRSRARAWFIGLCLALGPGAHAENILRRSRAEQAVAPPGSTDAAAAAAASAQSSSQAPNNPLRRALDAIDAYRRAQAAARGAAQGAPGSVPDGLGGLVVDPGVATDPTRWQGASLPVEQNESNGRIEVTVTQSQQKAILTWQKFDVGKDTDLHFDQTAGGTDVASWSVLNRVLDPTLAPSRILGSIRAEGQVYVLNRNGIIFGGSSQVNVGSLVLSGLDLVGGDAQFRAGITTATFAGPVAPGTPLSPADADSGKVVVEPGAQIHVGNYGQAILLGLQVTNGGTIEAPDGQVLLVAGDLVSLAASADPGLRGLVPTLSGGRPVDNTGMISADRGDIMMLGGCSTGCVGIGQHGLLTTTTSAAANGSIYLGSSGPSPNSLPLYGRIEFGPGSVTQVLPDANGQKFIGYDETNFRRSVIEVAGQDVSLLEGATIYAPSGSVTLGKLGADAQNLPDDSRVYVASGARIDVSGLVDVPVSMESNTLTAQLRANELADNPILRNSSLRGRTIDFDARLGTAVANVAGYYDLVERDVKELMVGGGSVTLTANAIVTRAGSVIDLSGGSLLYAPGYVTSTMLVDPTGKRVRIEDAVPGVAYRGIAGDFEQTHSRWGITEIIPSSFGGSRKQYQAGYEQGGSAGSLTMNKATPAPVPVGADPNIVHIPGATAEFRILDGSIVATTIVGPWQRELPSGSTDPRQVWREQPTRGQLILQQVGDVVIGTAAPALGPDFGPESPLPANRANVLVLPASWFDGHTFGSLELRHDSETDFDISGLPGYTSSLKNYSAGGRLTIGQGVDVNLGEGGTFLFTGVAAEIDGSITAPGGRITLTALSPSADGSAPEIRLGTAGVLDVAGRLTNDSLDGAGGPVRALNGGTVLIQSSNVQLAQGSLVDASGGARLNGSGNRLTAGSGGAITIDTNSLTDLGNAQLPVSSTPPDQTLRLDGTLQAYSLGGAPGGALSLQTGYNLVIGSALPVGADPTSRLISSRFFDTGGFSSFNLLGERGVTVTSGTVVAPQVLSFALPALPLELPTGTALRDVAVRTVLPQDLQGPVNLTLTTVVSRPLDATPPTFSRSVTVESGAVISGPPQSRISLSALNQIFIDGTISAPGGAISIATSSRAVDSGQPLSQDILLGPNARLLVPGYTRTSIESGLRRRGVFSAGQIAISATGARGSSALLIDPQAVLDASGIESIADIPAGPDSAPGRYVPLLVDGAAGSIVLTARSGVLGGQLELAHGGSTGAAGTLTISAGSLDVRQSDLPGFGQVSPGTVSPASTLVAIADRINGSGADNVVLISTPSGSQENPGNRLLFDGPVTLHAGRVLDLQTQTLGMALGGPSGAVVSLSAPYVILDGAAQGQPGTVSNQSLDATLEIQARDIDIINRVSLGCGPRSNCQWGGFGLAHFTADQDIRFSDHNTRGDASFSAGLLSNGALELSAAQVYASRIIDDPANPQIVSGVTIQSDQSITIQGNGNPAPVPFSYGSTLTLQAPHIDQGGVLRAPQGQIVLQAVGPDGTVVLEPGSITSASLDGLTVPFNAIDGQLLSGGVFRAYNSPGAAPQKAVELNGANVSIRQGAVIDVSGGGDLLGYTFLPGNGGSQNVLQTPGAFAIIPSRGTTPAPAGGFGTLADPSIQPGDTVWLQGVPGIPDGYYTRLPAQYALMPGGYLVEPLGGSYARAPTTTVRADGAVIAAGFAAVDGTSIRGQTYGRYAVLSPSVFGQYSDLRTYSFNAYARDLASTVGVVARVPDDAGSAVINATRSLELNGSGRFGAGPGALAGDLDISAPNIAVVGGGASAPDQSYVTLDVTGLESFGAGSILLGGTRTLVTDPTQPGTAVTVNSTNVFVDTGGSQWTGPEILLAAKNTVTVAPGSSIAATGATSLDTSALLLTGDSALLRLSTGTRVPLVRTDVVSGPAPPGVGVLSVGAGADLSATGSLSLYGSGALALAPDARLAGPQLDVASTRINLGDAPPGTDGATLGPDTIARLASSSDLLLRGTGSIHLYPGLQLGSRDGTGAATLGTLTLDSPVLQADGTGGTSMITARDLGIRNSGPAAGASAAGSGNTLSLDVDTLSLGPGQVQLGGFARVEGNAGNIVLSGQGGLLVPGDISLGTAEIRALAGAGYELTAGGNLTLSRAAGSASTSPGAGGRLLLTGSSVAIDTAVVLPGGDIEAVATSGAVQLGDAAVLDVHGTAEQVVDQTRFVPGGTVKLNAGGALSAASGASIDVSGDASGGNAGSISLTSGDLLVFDARVEGAAGSGGQGGRISLDADRITDLSSLNQRLELGGFTGERSYRLRQQDIVIGQAEQITAHTVVLQSDTGNVTVAGQILAAGTAEDPAGGLVRLEGGNGVSVSGTAVIDAHAAPASAGGFPVASGLVELMASGGRISLAPGSSIDVSGGSTSGGGTLVLRAPRAGNDLAIDPLQGRISASSVVAQGLATYAWSDVDATRAAQMISDATTWLSGAASIEARLVGGNSNLPPVVVAPAMAVSSSGDLTVHAPLSLSSLGAPGSLRLSAGGSLLVQAMVSDGFDSSGALSSGRSFSFDLLAGQDIQIASGAMVRTGTGDIRISAGRDIVLADSTSVIYTAGMRTGNAPGFTGGQGDFPVLGGSIFLSAGRDILAPFPTQSTSAWLLRAGATQWNGTEDTSTVQTQTSWSILYGNFQSAVGALGGGTVQVSAGRDVVQLQVAIPTTGQLTTAVGSVPQPGDLVVRGGGDLEISAGRDVLGGVFMLGQGTADIQAGRDIGAGAQSVNLRPSVTSPNLTSTRQVAPLLGLMDASAKLTAGGSIDVEAVYDPMRQGQLPSAKPGGVGTAFVGYTDRTALEATAVSGDVAYENDPWASVDLTASSPTYAVRMAGADSTGLNLLFGEAPPTMLLASLGGNAYLRDRFSASSTLSLGSADLGNLTVLARNDVLLPISTISLGNVAAPYRRTALTPYTTHGPSDLADVAAAPVNQPLIHAADPTPLRLYAEGGSVCAYLTGSCVPLGRFVQSMNLVANKRIDVFAGQDVVGGTWRITGAGPDPISRIQAGRDIVDAFVSASGPGTVLLEAGRDYIEHFYNPALQQGGQILSVGNPTRVQGIPPDQASNIIVVAGTAEGVDYDGFAKVYLDPANTAGAVRTYLPELRSYMAGLGISAPTDAALVARFQALPLPDRQVFLFQVYFTELKETGIDYNNPDSPRFQSYQRGFEAVARLFPESGKSGAKVGDVLLDGKPLETQAEGNITILAPYGRIAVGTDLANISSGGGIVTRRGGDIALMADQNIDLFTSRVFTLQGGDITMWTSNGSITAGAGSKTSVLSAPLSYVTSPDGVITVNVFGLQTGAGIGVLDALQGTDPNRKRSRLDLIAPRGEVNAGDAGIRVIGDLNIAAQVVVGVENIQVTGSAVGVPKVTQVNVAALTSASQLTQAAAKEGLGPAAAPRTTVQDLPSIITVEVVGYETTDKTPGAADEKKKERKTR